MQLSTATYQQNVATLALRGIQQWSEEPYNANQYQIWAMLLIWETWVCPVRLPRTIPLRKPGWLFMCYTMRIRLVHKYAVCVYIQKLLLSKATKGKHCKHLPILDNQSSIFMEALVLSDDHCLLAESKHSAQWGSDECLLCTNIEGATHFLIVQVL